MSGQKYNEQSHFTRYISQCTSSALETIGQSGEVREDDSLIVSHLVALLGGCRDDGVVIAPLDLLVVDHPDVVAFTLHEVVDHLFQSIVVDHLGVGVVQVYSAKLSDTLSLIVLYATCSSARKLHFFSTIDFSYSPAWK